MPPIDWTRLGSLEEMNQGNILGLYILDDAGNPVECQDVLAWGQWLADHREQKRIDRTELGDCLVSTVFDAIDRNPMRAFGDGWPPILYETMAFKGDKRIDEDWACERYTTKKEALMGHAAMVDRVKQWLSRPL